MTVLKQRILVPFAMLACWPLSAVAQGERTAPSEAEDLEIPASRNTVPAAAPAAAPPESSRANPAAPAAGAPNSPANAGTAKAVSSADGEDRASLRRELEAVRARLTLLEHTKGQGPADASRAAAAPDAKTNAGAGGPINLEASAHSRPVPTGLRIGGYLQAQYDSSRLSEDQLDPSGNPLNQDRFSLRRGRLRLDRGWEYANATLELDASTWRGVNVGIRRAEAALLYRGKNADKLPPLVMLTLGVTDLPFGFELMESSRVRIFMERSLGSSAFFPTEMDAGVKVSGAIGFFRYAVALTNGEPLDTLSGRFPRDPNHAKDVTGRVGVETQPLPGFSIAGGTSITNGKGFHAGHAATKSAVVWRDGNEDGVVTPDELFGVPAAAATPSANFKRWAYALDLELELHTTLGASRLFGEAFVGSNMDRGFIVADPVETNVDLREAGGYVAFVQDISEWGFAGLRASIYDPNSDFLDSRRGKLIPTSAAVRTLSPVLGLRLRDRARLSFEYDFIRDHLAKDSRGVPTDAKNDQFTLRLQVEL